MVGMPESVSACLPVRLATVVFVLTNSQVDVEPRLQLLRRAPCDAVPTELRVSFWLGLLAVSRRPCLENLNLRRLGCRHNAVDEDAGQVDVVGIDRADFDNILGFHDGKFRSLGHQGRK